MGIASEPTPTVAQHFDAARPVVRTIYDRILREARRFGTVHEDPKKTSIHLTRKTAFAGVATRKDSLILTLKASADVRSSRVLKHERASANRWHLQVRLHSPDDVDAELKAWLNQAYALAG